jgi:hypothetical protein
MLVLNLIHNFGKFREVLHSVNIKFNKLKMDKEAQADFNRLQLRLK